MKEHREVASLEEECYKPFSKAHSSMWENNEQEMAIGVRVYDFMENTDHKEIPKQ